MVFLPNRDALAATEWFADQRRLPTGGRNATVLRLVDLHPSENIMQFQLVLTRLAGGQLFEGKVSPYTSRRLQATFA